MIDWEDHLCYIQKHKNTSPRRVAHSSFQQGRSVVTKCSHYAQPKACEGASEEEEGGGLCEPASTTPTYYVSYHHSGAPAHYVTSQRWTLNPLSCQSVGGFPAAQDTVHTILLIDKHAKNTRIICESESFYNKSLMEDFLKKPAKYKMWSANQN